MDQTAFTVVSYKKKRAAGVPVIFKPTQPDRNFWKVKPNLLASAVVTTAQEKVLSHRLNKDDSLMVTTSSVPAANRLLAVTDLAGIAVEARVPYSYSATYGRIQDVPVEYSDDDLKEYLTEQKSQEKLLGGSTVQEISGMLIPMMFAAIKALLCANPSLKDIPEIQAVLAFEPLVTTSFTVQRRDSSE
ncbi:hypothetical protein HPB52_006173 [Rhipicephalus sanguineus]|uniref:Uncharacterized protein n=1 Tax=Rhipicephalus sanguineus TaxID=34632 RepID=A0A9D4T8P0_RHISA|nr:hypothetical protein HPB52_006173 [Rhipicephalus sanguineus]